MPPARYKTISSVAALATAVALARILAFAAVVAGRAVALPFAGVLTLTGGFAAVIFHDRSARIDGSMGLEGHCARVKPGHSGAGEDHFGGFIHS